MELDSKINSNLIAFPIGMGVMNIPYIIAKSPDEAREHYLRIRFDKIMILDSYALKENIYFKKNAVEL